MEEKLILDHGNDEPEELELTSKTLQNLDLISRWAKLISICLYLGVIGMIYRFIEMIKASRYSYDRNDVDLATGIVYILILVFTFFAAFHLWSFASRLTTSLKTKNNKTLTVSIDSLKSYFKFYGFYLLVVGFLFALLLNSMWKTIQRIEFF